MFTYYVTYVLLRDKSHRAQRLKHCCFFVPPGPSWQGSLGRAGRSWGSQRARPGRTCCRRLLDAGQESAGSGHGRSPSFCSCDACHRPRSRSQRRSGDLVPSHCGGHFRAAQGTGGGRGWRVARVRSRCPPRFLPAPDGGTTSPQPSSPHRGHLGDKASCAPTGAGVGGVTCRLREHV